MEAVRDQKHHSKAKSGTKELIYWKKYLTKFLNNLKNTLAGPISLSYDLRVKSYDF